MAITLDSLRKAVKKSKGHSQALAWLADMERASGDYEAALKIVDQALAASPSDVPAMLVRAKVLTGLQDFAGSITEYKKVLAKDPFCLSAHKRMGESYDKLGKTAERNICFRRVHDMDPLDPFWKEEYDIPTEEEQTSFVPPMDDSSFTMDNVDEPENTEAGGEENIFANLAASLPNTDEDDNSSMDTLRKSLASVSEGFAENAEDSESAGYDDHVLNSSEVSSAISGILGGDDDFDVANSTEKEDSITPSLFSHFSDDEKKENTNDEQSKSDEIDLSLEGLEDAPSAENVESAESADANVDDAFSSLLGDDELPEETPTEKADETLFDASLTENVSESATDEQASEDLEASSQESPSDENSFDSLFEKSADADFSLLENAPEESSSAPAAEFVENEVSDNQTEASADETLGEPFGKQSESLETSAEPVNENSIPSSHIDFSDDFDSNESEELGLEDAPSAENVESADANVDDAFSSLLGDDELPEETPAEKADEALVEASLTENVESAERAESADANVDDAFSSLLGDDELPEETPAEKADEALVETSLTENVGENVTDEQPVENALEKSPEYAPNNSESIVPVEGLIPTSHIDFTDDEVASKTDDSFDLGLDKESSDEIDAEKKVQSDNAELSSQPFFTNDAVVENVNAVNQESSVDDESAVEEVDGAFDALFGDEDSFDSEDVADDKIAEKNIVEDSSSTLIGESSVEETQSEKFDVDDFTLNNDSIEHPIATETSTENSTDENLVKEMGGAFASMFGDDDKLALRENEEKTSDESPIEKLPNQEATGAELEESSVNDSLDASFENMFGTDDLPEEASVAEVENLELPKEKASENAPATENAEIVAEPAVNTATENSVSEPLEAPSAEFDSINSEVSNAFKGLFDEDDSLPESDEPNNKGVDYLMSGDSDDEVSASLVENADAPLSRGAPDLDDNLNTRTLADIYMEQGVYNKALKIYSDLAKKNPKDAEIKKRLEEIEKICREKFGES